MDRSSFFLARCRRTGRKGMICQSCAAELKVYFRRALVACVTTPCAWPELGLTLEPLLSTTPDGRVVVE